MKIAIIGAGLIGRKRAQALPTNVNLKAVCDINKDAGLRLAKNFNCNYEKGWKKIVSDPQINACIVSTTNNWLAPIAVEAIKNGKHVLIEKPGARNSQEFLKIIKAHKKKPVVAMVGYNHRYHPAIQKTKEIIDSNNYGQIMFIRARYGHGGRLGYEKEWRFNKKIAGGGELLDQGSHLINLVDFFAGKMDVATGFVANLFWKSDLEDSAFFILKNKKGQFAHLSATCIEWKNIFSFEIMLKRAKIQIDGLGGSYGQERLTLYKMKPEMGPPDVEEFKFPEDDISWKKENMVFFRRIQEKDFSASSLKAASYVLEIIDKIYKSK